LNLEREEAVSVAKADIADAQVPQFWPLLAEQLQFPDQRGIRWTTRCFKTSTRLSSATTGSPPKKLPNSRTHGGRRPVIRGYFWIFSETRSATAS
jgi:hypothetical protein